MAYTQFTKNMNIIAPLNDRPNALGNPPDNQKLSAADLKGKFDEGGLAIKNYINNTLLPELNATAGSLATDEEAISQNTSDITALKAKMRFLYADDNISYDNITSTTILKAKVHPDGEVGAYIVGKNGGVARIIASMDSARWIISTQQMQLKPTGYASGDVAYSSESGVYDQPPVTVGEALGGLETFSTGLNSKRKLAYYEGEIDTTKTPLQAQSGDDFEFHPTVEKYDFIVDRNGNIGRVGDISGTTVNFFNFGKSVIPIDTTLAVAGKVADAKAVGDELSSLKSALGEAVSSFTWTNGKYLVGTTGAEASNASYAYAKASIVSVPRLVVTTKCQNPAGICFYDDTDTFISGVNGSNSSALVPYTVNVPSNAASIGISCLIQDKENVIVDAVITSQVATLNNTKQAKATYNAVDQLALNQGIVNKNLTIYNPSASYTGRYVSAHYAKGTTIVITGQGVNANYPALVIAYDDSTTYSNYTSNKAYFDKSFTMPKSGTVYVSGNTLTYPVIKIKTMMSDSQNERVMTGGLYERDAKLMFKLSSDGTLLIKKRISDTESIRISLAHVGGNNLFGFSAMGIVEETQGERMNNTFGVSQTLSMSSTDWFSPYKVLAVNNADGDIPAGNDYFTGGNHRSNNMGEGGGITATEESFFVCVGGETPLPNEAYNTDEIVVKWSNLVQANNTSKSDGTGRAVLRESWTMHITKDGFAVENNIEALEAITLKTYYGLQAYYPGANVVYKGGATRTPVSISSASNSGNTSCREAVAQGTYYDIDMFLSPLDLGAFNSVPYGIFTTSASKLYFNLIGNDTAIQANEHYFISGAYKFW